MLGLGIPTLVAEILSFLVFLYVMIKLPVGFPLIARIMEERRQKVMASIHAAEADRNEAEALKGQMEEELRKSREETKRLFAEAERAAREETKEIIEEARRQAEGLVKAARQEIEAEKEAVLREVYGQVVELTIDVTRKVLGREIDEKEHRRLVQDTIGKVGRPQ